MTPMKTASNASERTQEQKKNFRRLLQEVGDHAAAVAWDKVPMDRERFQKNVLEKINPIRDAVVDAVIAKLQEFAATRLNYAKSVPMPASGEIILTEQLLREKYNFGWFGGNFRRLLLGKKLKGVPARSIAIHNLKEYSTNQQIKNELGEQAVTSFAYALNLVEKQRKGENGPLLTNGYANLMVVEVEEETKENGQKVIKKTFWVVNFSWNSSDRYWDVAAGPIGDPDRWNGGSQVISCDSETV